MGSAIGERIKARYRVIIFDKDRNKTQGVGGAEVAKDISDLVKKADTVILAIKPQDFDIILNEIKDYVKDKLIISIAAGITTQFIENKLGEVKVIRVMPNLPARIGKGVSCLCKGRFAKDKDLSFTLRLFKFLGITFVLNEEMMDAATAVSGSGPGLFYYLNEGKSTKEIKDNVNFFSSQLTESSKKIGLPDLIAASVSTATVEGSVAFLEKTNLSPAEAKIQVASPGGTTEAGLVVLARGGTLEEAVQAAFKRAKELSRR